DRRSRHGSRHGSRHRYSAHHGRPRRVHVRERLRLRGQGHVPQAPGRPDEVPGPDEPHGLQRVPVPVRAVHRARKDEHDRRAGHPARGAADGLRSQQPRRPHGHLPDGGRDLGLGPGVLGDVHRHRAGPHRRRRRRELRRRHLRRRRHRRPDLPRHPARSRHPDRPRRHARL
ncbi:MAG: Flagellar basal-body rod modification protein FlgD, partial [uncultured Nocardioidaceae bacterium]